MDDKSTSTEQKPDSSAQVATKTSAKKTFQQLVDSEQFKQQIALALPKHLTADRFIRVLMTATIKQPNLLLCTQESMFKGIFDAAAAGLEIDGRRAHLVPFKNNKKGVYEAVLIPDYKGIAELAMRSGVVSSIHADLVCEADEFEYDRGELKKHKIDFKKDRGAPYAYYVIVRMKDGGEKVEVMSKPQVDQIRRRSKSANEGPWVTDYDAMALKTVFKRASKWVPLSAEIRNVMEAEDDALHADEPTNVTPQPSLMSIVGAPEAELTEGGHIEKIERKADKATEENPPVDTKSYTPEQRAAHLGNLQSAMLDAGVSESKVLLYAHQNGLAKQGQDEVGSLDTSALEALLPLIPTLSGGKAK